MHCTAGVNHLWLPEVPEIVTCDFKVRATDQNKPEKDALYTCRHHSKRVKSVLKGITIALIGYVGKLSSHESTSGVNIIMYSHKLSPRWACI